MGQSRNPRLSLIVVALFLVMDFSIGASALVHVPEDTDESTEVAFLSGPELPPPLMCGDEECPEKDRSPGIRPVPGGLEKDPDGGIKPSEPES